MDSLEERTSPVFHRDMLVDCFRRVTRKWDWCPVKVVSKWDSGQPEQRWCDIDMGCDCIMDFSFWDSRTADIEWNPDVFVKSR